MTVWPEKAKSLCARADSSPCIDRGQNIIVLCDQGVRMDISNDTVSTLRAQGESHPPIVCAEANVLGFDVYNMADTGGGGKDLERREIGY